MKIRIKKVHPEAVLPERMLPAKMRDSIFARLKH